MLSKDVLPVPDAPIIAEIYPALNTPETSSRIIFLSVDAFWQGNLNSSLFFSTSTE